MSKIRTMSLYEIRNRMNVLQKMKESLFGDYSEAANEFYIDIDNEITELNCMRLQLKRGTFRIYDEFSKEVHTEYCTLEELGDIFNNLVLEEECLVQRTIENIDVRFIIESMKYFDLSVSSNLKFEEVK